MDGVTLAPVLRDSSASVREVALTQHPRPAYYDREPGKVPSHMGYSIRTATHRYTEWRDWRTGKTTARELYDHQQDPAETRNLAADRDAAAILESHAQRLQTLNPLVKPGWTPTLP